MKRLLLPCIIFLSSVLYGQQPDFTTKPRVQWKFKITQPFIGSPAISGQLVYAGGMDSTLHAVDLSTGKEKWKFRTHGQIRSTPVVQDNQVLLNGGDGHLYALDKASGKLIWQFTVVDFLMGDRLYDWADYYQSSPQYADGKVYFGSGDHHVYALDAGSGKLLWKYQTGGMVHTTPAVYQDRVFVGSFDGYFYALDGRSGQPLWKFKSVGATYFPYGEFTGSPVISNGLVYVAGRDYNLYALDINSGFAHWNKRYPRGWALGLSIKDSVLYAGTSDDRVVACLDGNTGQLIWNADAKFNVFGPPSFSKEMGYFGTLMGKVMGMDLSNGAIKWTFTTDGYEAHHLDYFNSKDEIRPDRYSLFADGMLRFYYDVGAIFSTPALSGDHLIVTSADGTMYGLVM